MKKVKDIFLHFSKIERIVFYVLAIILVTSSLLVLQGINRHFMEKVPKQGGGIIEGIVGTPRFVNPILASSQADQDTVALIYSGLLRKKNSKTYIPDLALKYDVDKNNLIYTFTLKDKIYFHNGSMVTSDDVIFTIEKMKDPSIKSPQKANWDGISVEKINDRMIKFTLKQPDSSFLQNATLGIMPKDLWDNSPIELNDANINPVGSGPYKIKEVEKQNTGIVNHYILSAFDDFALGKPFINQITLKFYQNEEEQLDVFKKRAIDNISSISPEKTKDLSNIDLKVHSVPLPRIFGLFLNQSQNQIFTDKIIAKAIDLAINKEKILDEVLLGYGISIESPIPKYILPEVKNSIYKNYEERLSKAKEMLSKDGWSLNEEGYLEKTTTDKNKKKTIKNLEFSISTGNAPELVKSAELIKKDLQMLGIKVDIKTFDIGNLNQSVIRPRKYDALLFGEIVNRESDLFAFWHSSQRKDPGLNVAIYTNAKVDKILEEVFSLKDQTERESRYRDFDNEIRKDTPAIFLYSPEFIYVVNPNIKGIVIEDIINPRDRFDSIYSWYIEEDDVWKIFSKQTI